MPTTGARLLSARSKRSKVTRRRSDGPRGLLPFTDSIRDGRDEDSQQLIDLVGAVFAEYPGCVLDVDGECPDLRAPASYYHSRGGRFWVAGGETIVASVSCEPITDGDALELKRLYVDAGARGRGLGTRLCRVVEDEARRRGVPVIELWTDTRFKDAHRLYRRLGYVCQPKTRDLHDLSNSTEYHFIKKMAM